MLPKVAKHFLIPMLCLISHCSIQTMEIDISYSREKPPTILPSSSSSKLQNNSVCAQPSSPNCGIKRKRDEKDNKDSYEKLKAACADLWQAVENNEDFAVLIKKTKSVESAFLACPDNETRKDVARKALISNSENIFHSFGYYSPQADRENWASIIQKLQSIGIDINASNFTNRLNTPLHIATGNQHFELAAALMNCDADPKRQNLEEYNSNEWALVKALTGDKSFQEIKESGVRKFFEKQSIYLDETKLLTILEDFKDSGNPTTYKHLSKIINSLKIPLPSAEDIRFLKLNPAKEKVEGHQILERAINELKLKSSLKAACFCFFNFSQEKIDINNLKLLTITAHFIFTHYNLKKNISKFIEKICLHLPPSFRKNNFFHYLIESKVRINSRYLPQFAYLMLGININQRNAAGKTSLELLLEQERVAEAKIWVMAGASVETKNCEGKNLITQTLESFIKTGSSLDSTPYSFFSECIVRASASTIQKIEALINLHANNPVTTQIQNMLNHPKNNTSRQLEETNDQEEDSEEIEII